MTACRINAPFDRGSFVWHSGIIFVVLEYTISLVAIHPLLDASWTGFSVMRLLQFLYMHCVLGTLACMPENTTRYMKTCMSFIVVTIRYNTNFNMVTIIFYIVYYIIYVIIYLYNRPPQPLNFII